jgi:DHA3 family macrolide efflux protein-like MFS transporter
MELKEEQTKPKVLLFINRNFLLVWIGQTISVIGDNLYAIALMWWVLEKTGSTALMATVAICATLPAVILGPFAGTYVDRVDRRKLLVFMDLGRAFLLFIPAILFFYQRLEVWHINIVAVFLSSMTIFFSPALDSFTPSIVEKNSLTRANSLIQFSRNLSGILGPSLAGVLMALFGAGWVMLLNGISFLVSGLAIFLVRVAKVEISELKVKQHFFADLWDGLVYLKKQSLIFSTLILFSLLNFFLAPIGILIPVMVKEVLKMGAEGFGFLMSAISVGMILGTLILGLKGEVKRKGWVVVSGIILGGLTLALFAISEKFWLSMIFLGIAGLSFSLVNVLAVVIFQQKVPPDKRGRFFGTASTLAQGLRPISLGLVGVISVWLNVRLILLFSGILVALGGLGGFLVKGMKEI